MVSAFEITSRASFVLPRHAYVNARLLRNNGSLLLAGRLCLRSSRAGSYSAKAAVRRKDVPIAGRREKGSSLSHSRPAFTAPFHCSVWIKARVFASKLLGTSSRCAGGLMLILDRAHQTCATTFSVGSLSEAEEFSGLAIGENLQRSERGKELRIMEWRY